MTNPETQKYKRPIRATIKELFFFVFLLPVFFVLHRCNDVGSLISFAECIPSLSILLIFSFILFLPAKLFFRNSQKASFFTFTSLFIFLFYPYNEMANAHIPFLEKPWLSLLLLLFVSLLILFWLIRIKNIYIRFKLFLTILLLTLISFEIILLLFQENPTSKPIPFLTKDEASLPIKSKPSVYVILMDEYAGTEALKKYAFFDNHSFCSELKKSGFSIIEQPTSNYRYTILSLASMLNGDYNPGAGVDNYTESLSRIGRNRVVSTFYELGYNFFNLSPVSMHEHKRAYKYFFLPEKADLILRPTILDDIIEFLPFFITRRLSDKSLLERVISQRTAFNYKALDQMLEVSQNNTRSPVFCYTHIMMPHGVYARDSMGKINTSFISNLNAGFKEKQAAYLQYLTHTNKTVLPYVNQLKKNTGDSAIIMLISDHGSRDIAAGKDKAIAYFNFAAVYYPKGINMGWYKGISNVNYFRVLFSDLSGKKLNLQKDSIIVR